MIKYVVVQYADNVGIDRHGKRLAFLEREPQDQYCGFDSIDEAAKGIVGAGDYIIAIDDGFVRPLTPQEQQEFDSLRRT